MRAELIIAEKEFVDQIYSKRFLVILGILLLLAVYAMVTGMDQYNKSLESYKSDKSTGASRFTEAVNYQQKAIDDAVNSGMPPETIESMKANLEDLKNNRDYFLNPSMPSLLQVFQAFTLLFGFLGMVLGIATGFDQMTKEKESGALKSVLSAPVYRDALINGKTIGSLATLAVAIGITFLVTIAIMLFYGVVPGLEDLARIFLFFIASMLYCATFFAIAMMTSTLARNSAMAVILAIGIVFTLLIFSIMSSTLSYAVAQAIVESAPEPVNEPGYYSTAMPAAASVNNSTVMATPTPYDASNDNNTRLSKIQREAFTVMQIADVLNVVSPIYDYTGFGSIYPSIAGTLLTKDKPMDYSSGVYNHDPYSRPDQATLMDSLSYIWVKALALLVETIVAFGISYIVFMRMDVR
jgi:ABC-2 type transport system permease protein